MLRRAQPRTERVAHETPDCPRPAVRPASRTGDGCPPIALAGPGFVPTANDDTYSAIQENTLTVGARKGVPIIDTDPEGDLLLAFKLSEPALGTVTSFDIYAGAFSYVSNRDYLRFDSFTYEITDAEFSTSGIATVTISGETPGLVGPDDPIDADDPGDPIDTVDPGAPDDTFPTAGDDAYPIVADTVLIVVAPGLLTNDVDPTGAPLIVASVTTTVNGWLALGSDGTFSYTPSPGFIGTDSFDYAALRFRIVPGGGPDTGTVTVTIMEAPAASVPPSASLLPSPEPSAAASEPGTPDDPDPTAIPSLLADDPGPTTTRTTAVASSGAALSLPNTGSGDRTTSSGPTSIALLGTALMLTGALAVRLRQT